MDIEPQPEAEYEDAEAYVRVSALEDYEGFCPISYRHGYLYNETGVFVDGQEFQQEDYFLNPGFLVVLLGGVDRETTVENAALAIHASIKSLFSTCGIPVHFERMRTLVELDRFVRGNPESESDNHSSGYRSNYSHVILVGHGAENGIPFLDENEPVGGERLAQVFEL